MMKRELKFCRETDEETRLVLWFADVPEWEGEKEELQMVAGADIFLDYLADDKNEVSIFVSDNQFEGADILKLVQLGSEIEGGSGAVYELNTYHNKFVGLHMWLCDVLKFVFVGFPEKIYLKKILK